MSGRRAYLEIGPFGGAAGAVRLPGSKSISNRVLLLAALAEGATEIHDLLQSDDTARMLDALALLGVAVSGQGDSATCRVTGCGGSLPSRQAELFLGNAGTALRPLVAVLALAGGSYRVSGVKRMHERPIGDLVDALRQIGAVISYSGAPGYPPLRIEPAQIRIDGPIRVRGDVSSQFLTALLMAMPLTGKRVRIEVVGELISRPYIDITLNLMARFGVQVRRPAEQVFEIAAGSRYQSPGIVHVEGDASGASYFLAAGAVGGGPVRIEGVGRSSIQGDVRFADALASIGAQVRMGDNWIEASAPENGRLRAFDLDCNHIPDAAMTLAVVALFCDGRCRLRNIGSWRVKETDRIAAMATELRKTGAKVEEGDDWLGVEPPSGGRLRPVATFDTYDDHRMAMCLSLCTLGGLRARINDPDCVAKTFPDYFDRLAEITVSPVIAIDGPSGSGKGTVAQRVAARLGFHYLDSGALYRVVALAALKESLPLGDAARLGAVAEALPVEFSHGEVLLAGERVTAAIRSEEVSAAASRVAEIPSVRQGLMMRQRAFRRPPGLVADGRDMGTVVFPDAVLKVYLTADAGTRAERRYKQLIEKGFDANLSALLQDLKDRDARDTNRGVAPLQKSKEALVLDTTGLSIDDAVDQVLEWYRGAQP